MAAFIQKTHVAQYLGYANLMMSGSGVLQVVAILEQTRSSYLATFLSLRKAIQQEAVVSGDNLKFLQCLEQPCRTLASATAKVHRLYTDPKPAYSTVQPYMLESVAKCCSDGKQQHDNLVNACGLYGLIRSSPSCLPSQRHIASGSSMYGKCTVMHCKGIACWLLADVTSLSLKSGSAMSCRTFPRSCRSFSTAYA